MISKEDLDDAQRLADSMAEAGSPYAYIIFDCIDYFKGLNIDGQ